MAGDASGAGSGRRRGGGPRPGLRPGTDIVGEDEKNGIDERLAALGFTRGQALAWAAVALLVLLVGGHYLRGQWGGGAGEASRAVTIAVAGQGETLAPGSAAEEGGTGNSEGQPAVIAVHVAGSVAAPGLYELSRGARAAEAIERAGGALPAADLDRVNLAARLEDGQQLFVPAKGQPAPALPAGTGAGGDGNGGEKIDLNTAGIDELEQLDGVGEKTARKIIAYREEHGGFRSIEELMQVPGIGPAKFAAIRDSVRV